jgi:hypothetical protein
MTLRVALFALLVVLLAASSAVAQEPPGEFSLTSGPHAAPRPTERPSVGLRVLAELSIGTVAMGSLAVSGCLLGSGPEQPFGCLVGASLGAFVAGPAVDAAILGIGHSLGGSGGYGWTMLGTVIGGLVSGGIMFASSIAAIDENFGEGTTVLALLPLLLPVIGGVLGYELSSGEPYDGPNIAPSLALSEDGATIAVGGQL